MFYFYLVHSRLFATGATIIAGVGRLGPACLVKAAYLLAFSIVVSWLIAPNLSRGQFRGAPAFNSTIPGIPSLPPRVGLPPPPPLLPLNNLLTDSTGGFGTCHQNDARPWV